MRVPLVFYFHVARGKLPTASNNNGEKSPSSKEQPNTQARTIDQFLIRRQVPEDLEMEGGYEHLGYSFPSLRMAPECSMMLKSTSLIALCPESD